MEIFSSLSKKIASFLINWWCFIANYNAIDWILLIFPDLLRNLHVFCDPLTESNWFSLSLQEKFPWSFDEISVFFSVIFFCHFLKIYILMKFESFLQSFNEFHIFFNFLCILYKDFLKNSFFHNLFSKIVFFSQSFDNICYLLLKLAFFCNLLMKFVILWQNPCFFRLKFAILWSEFMFFSLWSYS